MSEYVSGNNFSLSAPVNAKEIGEELRKLGNFTPKEIVDAARDPRSVLHKYFEWNDSIAAERFRLQQARHLVVAIQVEDSSGDPYRAFESVVIADQRVYVPIEEISKSPELIDQVLNHILKELLYWRAKHKRYEHIFGGIFSAIDEAEEALRKKNEKGKGGKATRRGNGNDTADKKANSKHNPDRGHAVVGQSVRGKGKARDARKTHEKSQRS